MKTLVAAILAVLVSGCAQVTGLVPSFWDDNQSAKIVDLAVAAQRINCDQPQAAQAQILADQLQWFRVYSELKGSRQRDVLTLTLPIEQTVQDWQRRTHQQPDNKTYCVLKREILVAQTKRAAQAVLGRF